MCNFCVISYFLCTFYVLFMYFVCIYRSVLTSLLGRASYKQAHYCERSAIKVTNSGCVELAQRFWGGDTQVNYAVQILSYYGIIFQCSTKYTYTVHIAINMSLRTTQLCS